MFEERICGMVGAEGSAHGGDGDARLATLPNERHHFFGEIGIEDRLDIAAMKWMRALVVKAQTVDGVDAVDLDTAAIDEIRERTNHSLPFHFPLVASTGGKRENRGAPVAVDSNAKIETKAGRMPAVIFTFHLESLLSAGEKYASHSAMLQETASSKDETAVVNLFRCNAKNKLKFRSRGTLNTFSWRWRLPTHETRPMIRGAEAASSADAAD